MEITTISYFWLSQGSAATHWRYDGKYYMGFARNLLGFLALEALRNALYKFKIYFKTYLRLKWKNFESPLRIDKVKFEFGVQFFLGHPV